MVEGLKVFFFWWCGKVGLRLGGDGSLDWLIAVFAWTEMGLKRLFVWLLGLYQANNIVSAGWLVWMELVGLIHHGGFDCFVKCLPLLHS